MPERATSPTTLTSTRRGEVAGQRKRHTCERPGGAGDPALGWIGQAPRGRTGRSPLERVLMHPSCRRPGAMPRQRTHHSRGTHDCPDDFPQRLVRFKGESDLLRAELNRRLDIDLETVRRWRDKGAAQHAALCSAPESGGLAGPRPTVHRVGDGGTNAIKYPKSLHQGCLAARQMRDNHFLHVEGESRQPLDSAHSCTAASVARFSTKFSSTYQAVCAFFGA